MGCNVSKDGKEKSKKSASNSQRSSTKENGKGTAEEKRSLVSEVITTQEPNESADIDIDCEDPEVQQAATKIQAAFRGSQARKTLSTKMQEQSDKRDAPLDEEIDANDPEVNQAAAKIQASFRGHMVRKDMKKQEQKLLAAPDTSHQQCGDDEIDIDLNDPNVEKAATKIQASFRGHLVRKKNTPDDATA